MAKKKKTKADILVATPSPFFNGVRPGKDGEPVQFKGGLAVVDAATAEVLVKECGYVDVTSRGTEALEKACWPEKHIDRAAAALSEIAGVTEAPESATDAPEDE